MTESIALIGVGAIGRALAAKLIEQGHRLTLWNRTREKAEGLGATVADSPEEAITPGVVLISVLSDDDAVDTMFADGKLAEKLGPEGLHIGVSTISPEAATRLAEVHRRAESRYVSAPVMGRPDMIEKQVHHFLLGGAPEDRERAAAILDPTGKGSFAFGDEPAAANAGKIINNFLIAVSINALGQAFVMAEKNGVDPAQLYEQATGTLFACPLWKSYGKQILERDFQETLFKLSLGLKDMKLAEGLMDSGEIPFGLLGPIRDRYTEAMAAGMEEKDWTAVSEIIRREAGLK